MPRRILNGLILTAAFATLCLALNGCAPKKEPAAPPPLPPPPPATLSQIKNELTQAKAQLEVTTASMNTLGKSSVADVAGNYDKFSTESAKLKSNVQTCRSRADDLKKRTQAYFDTWNKQAEVQNAELRRSATAQRAEAEKTFSTIKSEIELMKLSLDPYMSHLNDISSYLKDNKSPAALATVQDLVTKANADSAEVSKHADAVLAGINKIMAASGEGAPVPAPAK